MLSTDRFVFLHLHKSGGTFINQLLLRYGRRPQRIGYHLPYREAPLALRGLPVLGAVRDPFGYYVSWYHFQRGMREPNPLFMLCSDDGRLAFAATIRNLLWLEDDAARLDRFEDAVPDTFQNHGLNFTKGCVRALRGSGLGFYSFLYRRMFEGAERPHLVRTERIREDLPGVLARLGAPLSVAATSFLREVPNLNASRHGSVDAYYDAALRADVLARDAPILELRRGLP